MGRKAGESWLRGQALVVVMQATGRLGERDRAEAAARESVVCLHGLDDRRSLVALFEAMAAMAADRGTADRVATLLGCSDRLLDSIASPLLDFQRPRRQKSDEFARGRLGEAAFAAARSNGFAMSIDEAVAYAIEQKKPAKPTATAGIRPAGPLTRRELEIARLIADGMTTREIASKLFISERTVETHVTNMLNKLGLDSRIQLTRWVVGQENR